MKNSIYAIFAVIIVLAATSFLTAGNKSNSGPYLPLYGQTDSPLEVDTAVKFNRVSGFTVETASTQNLSFTAATSEYHDIAGNLNFDTEGQTKIDSALSITETTAGNMFVDVNGGDYSLDAEKRVSIDGALSITETTAGNMFFDINGGDLSIDAEKNTTIDSAKAMSLTSAEAVYVQSVSGTAGTSLQAMKSVVLFLTATEAAATVTLAGGATFSGIGEYAIFLQPIGNAAVTTGTAAPIDGSTFTFQGAEGVKYCAWLVGN